MGIQSLYILFGTVAILGGLSLIFVFVNWLYLRSLNNRITALDEEIEKKILKTFDLSVRGIIRDLKLRRPLYQQTAAYGHFGCDDLDLPWEKTDKTDLLRQAAGLEKEALPAD